MKTLIWKECRDNLVWAGLPALLILLPMVLLGGPSEPVFGVGGGVFLFLIAALFAATLGFRQVAARSRGDPRSILLHRPLSRTRIFLCKAIAGGGIYLVALAIPFVCLEGWMATPGNMAAPYDWRTGLPWLADIQSGLIYYFAGMLTAQREARWYGSRGLGLAAAFGCTLLVWTLPEFWQAFLASVTVGALVGVAAWGSFLTGGAYAPQPRIAKAALGGTLLTGLLVVSVISKFIVGQWFDSGRSYGYALDRQGRILVIPWKSGVGPTGTVTDIEGRVPSDLQGKRVDRNLIESIEAPLASLAWPKHHSYRNPGRYYVRFFNDSTPGNEAWFYSPAQGRLLGYDAEYHQFLGSFGPDGFVPAGDESVAQFQGEIRYLTRLWEAFPPEFLVFPGGVYTVDFSRRTVHKLLTSSKDETVLWACRWNDRREKHLLVVVSTDTSVHFLTEAGTPVVTVPREFDRDRYGSATVSRLENAQRYLVRYGHSRWLEPEESRNMPGVLLEYDGTGTETARRMLPSLPTVMYSPAQALFGLATPPIEVAARVGTTRRLRSESRLTLGTQTWVLGELLELWIVHFIPESVYCLDSGSGLFIGFTALTLVSASLCALVCYLLARRYSFSKARCLGWTLCGLFFGVVGLLFLLSIQEWPARIACPSCRQPRRVDRDLCERCGAPHAPPAADGTEIFEDIAAAVDIRHPAYQL